MSAGAPTRVRLVERQAETAALAASIARAAAGDGGVAVVEGPPGIGKSALLGAAGEQAREAGMRVLTARGGVLERGFPHGVARQLLERELRAAEPARRERLLAGAAARAAPALGLDGSAGDGEAAPAVDGFSVVHGLFWLACGLAEERPLALVVDDLHWCDDASRRMLAYLARRLEGLPLWIAVASRPRETAAEGDAAAALAAEPGAVVLRPAALSPGGTAELIAAAYGGAAECDRFAAACHAATGGNPFMLGGLIDALRDEGVAPDDAGARRAAALTPDAVARSVLLRLRRAEPEAVELARAVAILGEDVDLRHAAGLADLAPDAAAAAADRLARLHLLADGRPLNVVHPMIGEIVRGELAAGDRALRHARAARLLAAAGEPADRVAEHLVAADAVQDEQVVATLRAAAASARAQGDPQAARRWLRRALGEGAAGDRWALLQELGEAEWHAAEDLPAALAHLRAALEAAGDDARRARSALVVGRCHGLLGDVEAAVAVLGAARRTCAEAGSEALLALEAEEECWYLLGALGGAHDWSGLERRAGLAGETLGEQLVLSNLAALRWRAGTAAEATAFAARALADDRLLHVRDNLVPFGQACWVLVHGDAHDACRAVKARREALVGDAGSPMLSASAEVLSALLAYAAGDVLACEAHARAAIGSDALPAVLAPSAHGYLACALIERGEPEEALHVAERTLAGPGLPLITLFTFAHYARGRARQAHGRVEEALADFREYGRRDAVCGIEAPFIPWRLRAAECLLALGAAGEARELVAAHGREARRWGTGSAIGGALRGEALLAVGEERVALLEAAVAALAGSPARLGHAEALVDLGAALRAAGRRADALGPLRDGVERAQRCGARALVGRGHAELVAAGARPRRLRFNGVDALTASERRVAELAASGRSNAQIAQTLFVTRSTVEKHLGRAYRKLGVEGREALAAALSDPGARR